MKKLNYLLTNNPDKINGLKKLNINILKNINLEYEPNPFNHLYLKSKTLYGHDLNKTNTEINNYNLPFEPIKPFEPYNLENLKRFVYCASYYIPIKPYHNNFLLSPDIIKKLNIKDKKSNNLYYLNDDIVKKYNINDPYWFKVNCYDISTIGLYFIEYTNPYNSNEKITL